MAKTKSGRTRSETLSLRIDPKLRYRLDLIARLEDRTITSVIDRMADNYFNDVESSSYPDWFEAVHERLESRGVRRLTYRQLEDFLWSDDEAIRSMRYFLSFPEHLNSRERVMSNALFSGSFEGKDRVWSDFEIDRTLVGATPKQGSVLLTTIDLRRVHNNWDALNTAADEVMETGLYKPVLELPLED